MSAALVPIYGGVEAERRAVNTVHYCPKQTVLFERSAERVRSLSEHLDRVSITEQIQGSSDILL